MAGDGLLQIHGAPGYSFTAEGSGEVDESNLSDIEVDVSRAAGGADYECLGDFDSDGLLGSSSDEEDDTATDTAVAGDEVVEEAAAANSLEAAALAVPEAAAALTTYSGTTEGGDNGGNGSDREY